MICYVCVEIMNFFFQILSFLRRQLKLVCGHNDYITSQQRRLIINAGSLRRSLNRNTPRRTRRQNRALYKAMMKRIDELESEKV